MVISDTHTAAASCCVREKNDDINLDFPPRVHWTRVIGRYCTKLAAFCPLISETFSQRGFRNPGWWPRLMMTSCKWWGTYCTRALGRPKKLVERSSKFIPRAGTIRQERKALCSMSTTGRSSLLQDPDRPEPKVDILFLLSTSLDCTTWSIPDAQRFSNHISPICQLRLSIMTNRRSRRGVPIHIFPRLTLPRLVGQKV